MDSNCLLESTPINTPSNLLPTVNPFKNELFKFQAILGHFKNYKTNFLSTLKNIYLFTNIACPVSKTV